ncbi:MAG: plasmid mobilization relaxosome protein MobC [Cyanobacteria bacterium P01_A01_bin.123]
MNKKAPENRRTHQVKVLFTATEHQQLLAASNSAGRLPGTYCRLKSLDQDQQLNLVPQDLKYLDGQLGRLGGNLNQLAHHLNSGNVMGSVDAISLHHTLTQLHTLILDTQTMIRSATKR